MREKAIEIANALLRDGYEEKRAIAIATSQAKKVVNGDEDSRPRYEVHSHEEYYQHNIKIFFNFLIKERDIK